MVVLCGPSRAERFLRGRESETSTSQISTPDAPPPSRSCPLLTRAIGTIDRSSVAWAGRPRARQQVVPGPGTQTAHSWGPEKVTLGTSAATVAFHHHDRCCFKRQPGRSLQPRKDGEMPRLLGAGTWVAPFRHGKRELHSTGQAREPQRARPLKPGITHFCGRGLQEVLAWGAGHHLHLLGLLCVPLPWGRALLACFCVEHRACPPHTWAAPDQPMPPILPLTGRDVLRSLSGAQRHGFLVVAFREGRRG